MPLLLNSGGDFHLIHSGLVQDFHISHDKPIQVELAFGEERLVVNKSVRIDKFIVHSKTGWLVLRNLEFKVTEHPMTEVIIGLPTINKLGLDPNVQLDQIIKHHDEVEFNLGDADDWIEDDQFGGDLRIHREDMIKNTKFNLNKHEISDMEKREIYDRLVEIVSKYK